MDDMTNSALRMHGPSGRFRKIYGRYGCIPNVCRPPQSSGCKVKGAAMSSIAMPLISVRRCLRDCGPLDTPRQSRPYRYDDNHLESHESL